MLPKHTFSPFFMPHTSHTFRPPQARKFSLDTRVHTDTVRLTDSETHTCVGGAAAVPWAHESRFLDPSERRLQAERIWGLSISDHYFLIILGPERTVDAEQSGAAMPNLTSSA